MVDWQTDGSFNLPTRCLFSAAPPTPEVPIPLPEFDYPS